MHYSQFSKQLKKIVSGVEIRESLHVFDNIIQRTKDNNILINNEITNFKTLSEARNYIKYTSQAKDIIDTLHKSFFTENISKIADIIKEEHNIKVTNNIIEQYIKIASDKTFSIDPVIIKIREMWGFEPTISGKLHYHLNDGSIVAIDVKSQNDINTILEHKLDVVEFMKESSDNFLKILGVIIKDQ